MSFSADAIGFYLQAEDQLSPVLSTAASNYDKYVGAMEKANKRAFDSTSGALGQVAALVASVEKTPQAIGAAYSQVLKTMKSKAKAFTQPINFAFSSKDRKMMARDLANAVHKAMSGANIRLGATYPARKLGMFDSSYALRTMYSSLTQPPDMKGTIRPKKFAEGGIADGPGKNFDSVLSLLTPGEIVLPKSVSDNLLEMAAGLGGAQAADLGKSIAGIDNLASALSKMKGAIDQGLGSTADIKEYEKGVKQLSGEVDELNSTVSSLSYNTRVRLAASVKTATTRMDEFTEAGESTQTVFEKLFKDVIGPARFIALSKGLDSVVASFNSLSNQASAVAGDLEGGGVESAVKNYNQLNKKLRLSRSELRAFKQDAAEAASDAGVNANIFSEAVEGLSEAGVRNKKLFLDLAPVITLFTESSGVAMGAATQEAYRMGNAYEMTEGVIAGVFDNIGYYQSQGALDADVFIGGMSERFDLMGGAMLKVSTEGKANILNAFGEIGAATTDLWGGDSNAIPNMIAKAMSGTVEGVTAARVAFGMTSDQLRDALASGDPSAAMNGFIERMERATSPQGRETMMEAMGFTGNLKEFTTLQNNIPKLRESLVSLGEGTIGPENVAGSMERLQQSYADSLTTMGKFRVTVSNLTSNELPFLGVSTAEVIDGINDIGPTTILAIGSLAKLGVQAVVTSGKMLMSLPGAFGKIKGLMSGAFGGAGKGAAGALTSVSKAAGGLSGAASGGGFFAGLAAGLTSLAGGIGVLGAVLISPPGIAFSVTMIVALLALAAAARIATPAFKVMGKVVEKGMSSMVEVFGLAAPVFQTFIETAGGVFLEVLDQIGGAFKSLLGADPSHLMSLGTSLVPLAFGISAVGAAVAVLGLEMGLAAVGVGAFRLASGGGALGSGLAVALDAIVGGMGSMSAGPAMIANAEAQVYAAVGFVGAYGMLLNAIERLPGGGMLSGIFGDDPGEQLREHATSIARAVKAMQIDFNGASSLRQSRSQASFTPAQIDTVINAVAEAGLNDDVRNEMMENNRILRKILGALVAQVSPGTPAPPPAANAPARPANSLTRELGGFGV